MPRRCLHGVHLRGLAAGCKLEPLPRRCLHGVHPLGRVADPDQVGFASALPARGASGAGDVVRAASRRLCLGAACTGCIMTMETNIAEYKRFASALPARGASAKADKCGTPFCSIRRESVDSFSEINNKDSCADYFPALFCCQGDLHHHYRQPRTGNRPVLRCEQHRLFLFILSSHYRRLL